MPRPFYKCTLHPSEMIHLYCATCQVPICSVCTANHIHGQVLKEDQGFIDITKAYHAIVQELHVSTNSLLNNRKKQLAKLRTLVETYKDTIDTNCQEVEAACNEKLQKVMNDLQDAIVQPLQSLVTAQVENKRQLNELYWCEGYICHVKNLLMPADYLRAWLQHCKLQRQLDKQSTAASNEIYANVKVAGHLGITLGEN
ncbi:B-box-type zinc finger [Babesia duncani]|uniref:B-box-type zinc finger n=1 Tax=Babesia duncani TaxID=323732 RepID=A0AAD9PPF2_9APIC|nr:B-box-type zinc finger [Babesia duncani]